MILLLTLIFYFYFAQSVIDGEMNKNDTMGFNYLHYLHYLHYFVIVLCKILILESSL
jgi:hypothetical protein